MVPPHEATDRLDAGDVPAAGRDELLGRVRRFEEAGRRRAADLRTKPARGEEFAATLWERLEA
ncbi:hypothetical protein [Streptomyces sp. HO565]|uniref:hypothetical protein n=1 Tax=Streptomyces sp. HO565 TaxID=2857489 RepID=UPI0038B698FD